VSAVGSAPPGGKSMCVTNGSTTASKTSTRRFCGTNVVSDLTCIEFSPGIATPVPLTHISSIITSEESRIAKPELSERSVMRNSA